MPSVQGGSEPAEAAEDRWVRFLRAPLAPRLPRPTAGWDASLDAQVEVPDARRLGYGASLPSAMQWQLDPHSNLSADN